MLPQLFANSFEVLHKNMTLRQQRHDILSANIANVETPGFIAKDLDFEATLRQVANPQSQTPLWRTDSRHLPTPTPAVSEIAGTLVTTPSDDVGNDLNTVSIDREMAKLTMNTFTYNASAEILSRTFDQLKRAVNEGG